MNTTKILCRHLRSKTLYVDATAEEAFAEKSTENASPCHPWCNLTQSVKGADDRLAGPQSCNCSRSCFED